MLRQASKRVAVSVAALAAGASVAAYNDEGTKRAIFFNYYALPALAHYRWTEWRTSGLSEKEQDEALERLHEKYAPVAEKVVRELKGFYIKLGQMGSTRADFIAEPYLKICERLQDDCPNIDYREVKAIVEKALGRPMGEVFQSFEEESLGSASIGQTHAARLKDSGQEVVVKVQYPWVERLFRSDVATIRFFCKLAQPEHLPFIDEIERAFATEFDYAREAKSMQKVGDNMRKFFSKKVVVPKPLEHLCKKNVIVMEYLHGIKLVDAMRAQWEIIAARHGKTLEELKNSLPDRQSYTGGTGSASVAFWISGKLSYFADLLTNMTIFFINAVKFVPRMLGANIQYTPQVWPRKLLNPYQLMDTLLEVHGHQVLHDGLFNGDCHPGNILMLDDGRIGLIDYGQIAEISLDDRRKLARLILCLAEGNRDNIIKAFRDMGFKTKKNDEDVCYKSAVVFFDRDSRDVTEGMNIQRFLEVLSQRDPVVCFPQAFIMSARTVALLKGLGTVLNVPVSVASAWCTKAKELQN